MKKLFLTSVLVTASVIFSTVNGIAASQDSTKVRHTETIGKAYNVNATVKKIFREEKKITLAHEKIKGVMPAMTMTFPVSNPSILDKVKVGNRRIFTIIVYKGLSTVVGVKPQHRKR